MTKPNQDRRELGERLKDAREYLGLSQEEVAKALAIPRSAISLMESGKRRIDSMELTALARLYHRPISYLSGDEDTPPFPEEVQHLARTATKLSPRDREELARFAEFLSSRRSREGADGD